MRRAEMTEMVISDRAERRGELAALRAQIEPSPLTLIIDFETSQKTMCKQTEFR
jgi:hypothetical protein